MLACWFNAQAPSDGILDKLGTLFRLEAFCLPRLLRTARVVAASEWTVNMPGLSADVQLCAFQLQLEV